MCLNNIPPPPPAAVGGAAPAAVGGVAPAAVNGEGGADDRFPDMVWDDEFALGPPQSPGFTLRQTPELSPQPEGGAARAGGASAANANGGAAGATGNAERPPKRVCVKREAPGAGGPANAGSAPAKSIYEHLGVKKVPASWAEAWRARVKLEAEAQAGGLAAADAVQVNVEAEAQEGGIAAANANGGAPGAAANANGGVPGANAAANANGGAAGAAANANARNPNLDRVTRSNRVYGAY